MGWGWRPYVSVATRRAKAQREMRKLEKQGMKILPIEASGRRIARTFWGQAWCEHLENFSDYENRLPRGRTYVRNGSVCHLDIASGAIKAIVSGSDLYNIDVSIKKLPESKWDYIKQKCSGKIGTLLELLTGRLSESVMESVTDRHNGMFPLPKEISMECDCPDWADLCKHLAAVLYGVGARLDDEPELLFVLRGVNHLDLVEIDAAASVVSDKRSNARRIDDSELSDVFGIELFDIETSNEQNGDSMNKSSEQEVDLAGGSHSSANRKEALGTKVKKSAKNSKTSKKKTGAATKQRRKAVATSSSKKSGKSVASTNSRVKKVTAASASNKENGKIKGTSSRSKKMTDSIFEVPTGKSVRQLREYLDMSQSQFAELIGASVTSVSNWEKRRGKLNLQARTMSALQEAEKLSKRKAWSRIIRLHCP